MRKMLISIILIIILVNLICIINFKVYAVEDDGDLLTNMETQASSFLSTGKTQADSKGITIGNITSNFVGIGKILTMIGAGVMVAVTTFMGIKYLTASPEGQAKLKQQLIGVFVSGVVIFGAYYIWSIVLKIVSQFD